MKRELEKAIDGLITANQVRENQKLNRWERLGFIEIINTLEEAINNVSDDVVAFDDEIGIQLIRADLVREVQFFYHRPTPDYNTYFTELTDILEELGFDVDKNSLSLKDNGDGTNDLHVKISWSQKPTMVQ